MRPGSIAIGVAAAAVAAVGLYLFVALGSEPAPPSPTPAVAEAHHDDSGSSTPDHARIASPQPRKPRGSVDPDTAPRVGLSRGDLKKAALAMADEGNGKLGPPDLVNPKEYAKPTEEQTDTLTEANKLYDRGDFDGARVAALKMLEELPGNVRMLRVVVSSSCLMGDADTAQKYATQLPQPDHEAMVARCKQYEIALK